MTFCTNKSQSLSLDVESVAAPRAAAQMIAEQQVRNVSVNQLPWRHVPADQRSPSLLRLVPEELVDGSRNVSDHHNAHIWSQLDCSPPPEGVAS